MAPTPGIADVRGFYEAIGISLPSASASQTDVSVRCFVNPEAHQHADRRPSTAVSLRSGAFICHTGCGSGGAYQAALLQGRTPREAVQLLIDHGFREERPFEPDRARQRGARPAALPVERRRRTADHRADRDSAEEARAESRAFATRHERSVRRAAARLAARPHLLAQLEHARGWSRTTLAALDVGWLSACTVPSRDPEAPPRNLPGRVVIPIRDRDGLLVGVRKYTPAFERDGYDGPKLFAVPGSRRELFPGPERYAADPDRPMSPGNHIVFCEGEPDALAAIAAGYAAVSIPGVAGWRPEWASRFAGRSVTLALDADRAGREAAERIAGDLRRAGALDVRDWDPLANTPAALRAVGRDTGYDLTDAFNDVRARRRADIREALLPPIPAGYDPSVDGPDESRGRGDRAVLLPLARRSELDPMSIHTRGENLAVAGLER